MVDQVDRVGRRQHDLTASLREHAAADLLRGLGAARAAPILAGVARLAVRRFVADLGDLDAAVAHHGLAAAGEVMLSRYAGDVTVRGADRVPTTGPLVAVANHAGTVDTPVMWSLLAARPDLRVIALNRPVLHAMPHLASRLLYVDGDAQARAVLVRRAADHLRSGGALLTFPAGEIEPDPALRRGDALASLATWGSAVELFVRLVPDTAVLPVAVSGVISERMLHHPLARWRRTPADRELAAATLQVLVRDRSIAPVVSVGRPLRGGRAVAEWRSVMTGLLGER